MAERRSKRDRAVMLSIVTGGLFAVLAFFWYSMQQYSWEDAVKMYEKTKTQRLKEDKLISERDTWAGKYKAEKAKIPEFASDKKVDTLWLERLGAFAETNKVIITSLQASDKEETVGDLYELNIEVRAWRSSLESLVDFLMALDKADDAMLDVKSITIKPEPRTGYLKGSFTLSCAYMRNDKLESAEQDDGEGAEEKEDGDEK